MCDSVSGLLRWILAHDLPTKVILTCAHARELDPGKSELGVVLQGCIAHAPIGLPAQILACGVSRVEWRPCPENSQGYARMAGIWRGLTPDLVGEVAPGKKHFRHGEVIDLAAVPLPAASCLERLTKAPSTSPTTTKPAPLPPSATSASVVGSTILQMCRPLRRESVYTSRAAPPARCASKPAHTAPWNCGLAPAHPAKQSTASSRTPNAAAPARPACVSARSRRSPPAHNTRSPMFLKAAATSSHRSSHVPAPAAARSIPAEMARLVRGQREPSTVP